MKAWRLLPDTEVSGASVCDLFLNSANDGATLWSLVSDNLAPDAPLVGAFFDENGLADDGHPMCYIGYGRNKIFNLMLDSTWPMDHYDPIHWGGDSPDCRFVCSNDQPDGPFSAVERYFRTRPMSVLTPPADTDSDTLAEQHDEPIPAAHGDQADPLGDNKGDDCRSIRPLMVKYVSRDISRRDKARVVAHVRTCNKCFVAVESLAVKIKLEAENVKERLRRNRR
jgi:hypothetical protein